MSQYTTMSDEILVSLIKIGNDDAFKTLYERYLPKIKTMIYSFQGFSYEIEDLIQEATVGFYTAIFAYNENASSFSTFCYLCIRRILISLIKKSARKKSIPSNKIIKLEDIYATEDNNPEQIVIANEDYKTLKVKIYNKLTELERQVLFKFLSGYDNKSISAELCISYKSVDNALQRVKKKLIY